MVADELDERAEPEPVDPLERISKAIELAGLCLSLYYLWTIVRSDPTWEITRRAWLARVRRARRRVQFMRGDTVADEAALIIAREA